MTSRYEKPMLKAVESSIKTITKESGGLTTLLMQHQLNGTFRQLCDRKHFVDLVFPGTSKDVLSELPKDLKEILLWPELALDKIKIAKSASTVLANIKAKGEKQGDRMDSMTEQMLLPQIAQEALANGVIEAVRNMNRVVSGMTAKASTTFASPNDPQAKADQLDEDVIADLCSMENKFGVQTEYLGQDWSSVILQDMQRYVRVEKMSAMDSSGKVKIASAVEVMDDKLGPRIAWVDLTKNLTDTYPAIAEALTQMCALPYELNLKCKGLGVKCLAPTKVGCAMLLHYPVGAQQLPRWDSQNDGGKMDSGIRFSCAYHIVAAESPSSAAAAAGGSGGEDDAVGAKKETTVFTAATDSAASAVVLGMANAETNSRENCIILTNSSAAAITTPGASNAAISDKGNPNKESVVAIEDDQLVLYNSCTLRNSRGLTTKEYFVLMFFIKGKDDDQPTAEQQMKKEERTNQHCSKAGDHSSCGSSCSGGGAAAATAAKIVSKSK